MTGSSRIPSIVGWILSVLISALLIFSASMKIRQPPEMMTEWTKMYSAESALPIGIAELGCVVLFLIPRTSVLGGLLLVGYLGGAVSHHVRAQDAFVMPIAIGVAAWVALCLRDPVLWSIVPLRRRANCTTAADNRIAD